MKPDQWQGPEGLRVQKMFSSIAAGYDRTNNVLSAGIHHLWRKKLVNESGAQRGHRVLDCATGTGDLAIEFKKAVGPEGHVVGTDFCAEMLDFAPDKAAKNNQHIVFETADVTQLPYADNCFDISSISFGIRNVQDPGRGIAELARVIKPGGRVMILEFGQPSWPVFSQAYDFYSRRILPQIGGWITGRKDAYDYLQSTSAQFPCGAEFKDLMHRSANFSNVEYQALTGGIAYIYKATKAGTHS